VPTLASSQSKWFSPLNTPLPPDFCKDSAGKESACNAGDTGDKSSIPGLGRSPGGGKWQPTPVFLPEKCHGQRSLAGYSPKGHKEPGTTEGLSTQTLGWTWLLLPLPQAEDESRPTKIKSPLQPTVKWDRKQMIMATTLPALSPPNTPYYKDCLKYSSYIVRYAHQFFLKKTQYWNASKIFSSKIATCLISCPFPGMITLAWCASFQSFYAFTYLYIHSLLGFPGGSDGKESACYDGDLGLIPELGRSPGGGHDNPLQYSYLENPHGQRSLAWHGSWGYKVLDMTEQQHIHFYIYPCIHFCIHIYIMFLIRILFTN